MQITDIEAHLIELKDAALEALGVEPDDRAQITLADAPDPEMGDRGFPAFALARVLRRSPQQIAAEIVAELEPRVADDALVAEVLAAGPYVNFRLDRAALSRVLITQALEQGEGFGGGGAEAPARYMIEFSAPNTNKPQHLGHVRNDLLGESVTRLLRHVGHEVTPVNLINDRGVHICKSMLAYDRFSHGETPESEGVKGDHLVGHYYVVYNQRLQREYVKWQKSAPAEERFSQWRDSEDSERARKSLIGMPAEEALRAAFFDEYRDTWFNEHSELGQATRQMLRDWEDGDPGVRALWERMNQWVFDGFEATYARLGVHFDEVYYESETYLLGKDLVEEGLDQGIFRRLDDGAVACDLNQLPEPLDKDKILLRSDGTSVYMTQDLGTAMRRFEDHDIDRLIYVVGDEQRYHFRVLFGILGLLRPELEGRMKHLSYGMVELPEGKMKSREGTVVDADDLMEGMVSLAREELAERYPELEGEELDRRAEVIGLAAIKFYILDFNPTTTVHFDPKEALDFEGRTGPYAQYTYARIQSIGQKLGWAAPHDEAFAALGTERELDLMAELRAWPHTLEVAARDLDPGKITEWIFRVCKSFNKLYNDDDHRIRELEGPRRDGLLLLSQATAEAVAAGLELVGVETLEQM